MEDMNALKPVLLKHILLVCVLWLLTCCTRAASEDYRRIMWVSTTGEDSPQCIHAMPASDQLPIPQGTNEACGSLNYALKHIQNETAIVIACGLHVLKPVGSLLNGKPLMNITALNLMGVCENGTSTPQILCADRANLAFYNSDIVVIENLEFQGCGEQLKHSDSLRLSESSTLYFQNCRETDMLHLIINITGPYGRGISIIRNDTTITHGQIVIGFVGINHYGNHGSGINLEVLTSSTRDASLANESIHLIDIHVNYINIHTNYRLPIVFTGINISVMGDGENGEIFVSQIFIYADRSTGSNGISVTLHDSVHDYTITFSDITVTERYCNHTYISDIAKSAANNSTTYSSIKIELRGNSTRNDIRSFDAHVNECRVAPGSAVSIEVTDHSEENAVWLQKVHLLGPNSSEAHSRGLQVIVTGWARRNKINIVAALSLYNRAHWGAGGYIEYSGHATGNQVAIISSYLSENLAHRGGGIAVVCRDFATQNVFDALNVKISKNFAELGSGIYYILQDSSSNNTIRNLGILLFNNLAHSGGGMCIHIQDSSVANLVKSLNSYFLSNTLLSSVSHDMMGGGVHVEFSTVSATFRTDNIVSFTQCVFILNTAELGVGGGISLLYKHSHYQGDSGDGVIVHSVKLYNNGAKRGSACHFWSTDRDRKRLFRGVKITNSNFTITSGNISLTSQVLQKRVDINKTLLTTELHVNDHSFKQIIASLVNQSLPTVHDLEQVSQSMIHSAHPLKTNTDLIFTRSIQITADNIYMNCGAFAQGIFWGAEGAPILFSDLGLRMASCSYIYIYIFLSFCKWRRSRRSLQSFKSSLMTFRRV